jgi:hypothetical protein
MPTLQRETCHDCDVEEGQLHLPGCDMERCPFCGGQLISCGCVRNEDEFETKLEHEAKQRVPFVLYPNLCVRCGVLWPEMFTVSNEDWEHYVEPAMRKKLLCQACYKQIKAWVDEAEQAAE